MRVLIVNPMEAPLVREIGSSLEDLQRAVGGWVEALYPFDDDAAILCNEEGKLMGLDLNRSLRDENGAIYDVIAGTFLIAGVADDGFCSLSPEQIASYTKLYAQPEIFLLDSGQIRSIPVAPIGSEPLPENAWEETRNGIRLEISVDPDPIDPRRSCGGFGTMICFDKSIRGDPHVYPDPEAFFRDRLAAHFGSLSKADTFWKSAEKAMQELPPHKRTRERDQRILNELQSDHIFLPVYLYRHGGDAISTEPFSDPWDSGQIGWIYADRKQIEGQFGTFTPSAMQRAKEALENEVLVYNDYLNGENYTYRMIEERTGKTLDSGYWTGDPESLRAYAWNHAQKSIQQSKNKENPIK